MRKLYGLFALLALVLVIAACSPGTDKSKGDGDKTGSVEIFSWWTGAGEEDGLLALIDLFNEATPRN